MSDVAKKDANKIYEEESKQPYFKKIKELLDKYEDGWNVFIKAHEEKDFDIPVPRKEEFKDDPYLPDTWLELADRVISIIAHDKYKLDTMPNRIEIVRADQMLDAYVKPVPDGVHHWSYGKRRYKEQQQFDGSKHLAFEIIINSNPALAYCMDTNSPVMQMLVFAHASYGHNAVYKNNYLFEGFSDAETIMVTNQRLKELVEECEQKYGIEEVERVLDFCHAMRFIDTSDRMAKKKHVTKKELKEKAQKAREDAFLNPPRVSVFNDKAENTEVSNDNSAGFDHPEKGRRNILRFLADHGSSLPEWKRMIMRLSSDISQHFQPNMTTKVLNEGFACITHYQTMETLFDIGLINYSMHQEFRDSHSKVVYQPPGYVMRPNPYTGEEEEVFVGSDINIYSLGFAIFQDMKRVCENPTEEDKKWFPHIAGKADWIELSKHMMEANNDETLIEQYLSPKVMRDMKYFLLDGEFDDGYLEVSAIAADEGFRKVRAQLAADFRMSDKIPKISLKDYQEETDRCLVLQHDIINDQPLHAKNTQKVLTLINSQTGYPVVLESVDEDGEVVERYSSPPNYNHSPNQRQNIHYQMV